MSEEAEYYCACPPDLNGGELCNEPAEDGIDYCLEHAEQLLTKRKKELGKWKEPENALPNVDKCIPDKSVLKESVAPVPPVVDDTPAVVLPKEKLRKRDPYAEAGCIIV